MTTFRLIAAVLSTAAIAACGTPPAPVQPPATPPATTTTPDVPGADPVAWFEAYCTPMGLAANARNASRAVVGRAAIKDAVVLWVSMSAVSDRKIADDLEKLGPMGSDVQNPHERLIDALRLEAKGFDEAAARLQAQAVDDSFPERYHQIMINTSSEDVRALFKQIVDVPKYGEVFRANKVCADWQALAKQFQGK